VYAVLLESRAERELKKLPEEIFHRVIPRLRGLADNPKPSGCRKISGSKDDWRIRIGEYRVIYEIDEISKTVKIMRIRHRREVYR